MKAFFRLGYENIRKSASEETLDCGSGSDFGPADHREHHRLILTDRNIFHQAAPERFVEFRHRLGQLFQFIDEPLELPPADAALPDLRCDLFEGFWSF